MNWWYMEVVECGVMVSECCMMFVLMGWCDIVFMTVIERAGL